MFCSYPFRPPARSCTEVVGTAGSPTRCGPLPEQGAARNVQALRQETPNHMPLRGTALSASVRRRGTTAEHERATDPAEPLRVETPPFGSKEEASARRVRVGPSLCVNRPWRCCVRRARVRSRWDYRMVEHGRGRVEAVRAGAACFSFLHFLLSFSSWSPRRRRLVAARTASITPRRVRFARNLRRFEDTRGCVRWRWSQRRASGMIRFVPGGPVGLSGQGRFWVDG